LKHIAELIEKSKVKPIVDSVWKFKEFGEAFVKVESGHARGKVIIKVQK
jgi:NADPH:quinone reductase-like Zn-dependent oxidoreductase